MTLDRPGVEFASVLGRVLDDLLGVVGGLSDAELIRPTGCEGWRVADLVVHVRMGAEGLLAGLASPSEERADRDLVSYWKDWPARAPPGFAEVRSTWAMAAAYSQGKWLLAHFADVVAPPLGPLGRLPRAATASRVMSSKRPTCSGCGSSSSPSTTSTCSSVSRTLVTPSRTRWR
ncbi:MAG: maleylpyruvate isomerase N-terminal domain-containing protein [Actinomycetota bacterium]|nr:maleylpyruvate isomerase N-terminal domain-containing protein [Actinomycetota bacterium]MDA8355133.1 maleylpyruvate isomerase N-terminal domain-containing protein [Actinomycetota bacterium]